MFRVIGTVALLTLSSFANAKTTCTLLDLGSGKLLILDREVKVNVDMGRGAFMGGIGLRDGKVVDITSDADFKSVQTLIVVVKNVDGRGFDTVELVKITKETNFDQRLEEMGNSGVGSLDSTVGLGISDFGLNLAALCKNTK